MSIVRLGSSSTYAEGWDAIFGGRKAARTGAAKARGKAGAKATGRKKTRRAAGKAATRKTKAKPLAVKAARTTRKKQSARKKR